MEQPVTANRSPDPIDVAVDKMVQTSLALVATKLISGWLIVWVTGTQMRSHWAWGFVPYVGLETSATQFRNIAAWSTLATAALAVVWTGWHFARRRRHHIGRAWAAAAALPMAALLAVFEWFRRFNVDRLLPTNLMLWTVLVLGAASVLFVGFCEFPGDSAEQQTKPTPPQKSTTKNQTPRWRGGRLAHRSSTFADANAAATWLIEASPQVVVNAAAATQTSGPPIPIGPGMPQNVTVQTSSMTGASMKIVWQLTLPGSSTVVPHQLDVQFT